MEITSCLDRRALMRGKSPTCAPGTREVTRESAPRPRQSTRQEQSVTGPATRASGHGGGVLKTQGKPADALCAPLQCIYLRSRCLVSLFVSVPAAEHHNHRNANILPKTHRPFQVPVSTHPAQCCQAHRNLYMHKSLCSTAFTDGKQPALPRQERRGASRTRDPARRSRRLSKAQPRRPRPARARRIPAPCG